MVRYIYETVRRFIGTIKKVLSGTPASGYLDQEEHRQHKLKTRLYKQLAKKFGEKTDFTDNLTDILFRQAMFQHVLIGSFDRSVGKVMKTYFAIFKDPVLSLRVAEALERAGLGHPDVEVSAMLLRKMVRVLEPHVKDGPTDYRVQVVATTLLDEIPKLGKAIHWLPEESRSFFTEDSSRVFRVYALMIVAPGVPAEECAELVYLCGTRGVKRKIVQRFIARTRPQNVNVLIRLLQDDVVNAQAINELADCPDLLEDSSTDEIDANIRGWREEVGTPFRQFIERRESPTTPTS